MMIKRSGWFYIVSFLVLPCLLLYTCVKDPYKDQQTQENNQLAEYITKNGITVKPTSSGLYFIRRDSAKGDIPVAADYVSINYSATFLDGTLYDTNDTTKFKDLNGHLPWFKPGGPLTLSMSSVAIPGLIEGLSLMHEGDSATLLMPSSLAGNSFNPVPRIFHVKLLKVYHNIASDQKKLLDANIKKIGLKQGDSTTTAYTDTANVRGEGPYTPTDSDRVAVSYKLSIIDTIKGTVAFGRACAVVDSFKFSMDTIPKPLFYSVLKKMTRTGTAKIYFINGSGALYDNNTGQILVPPFSNLWYEVEFLGFVNDKGIIDKVH
jgi:FKBP-type peptidyl-prolyl cis-trans isomerase FkpA